MSIGMYADITSLIGFSITIITLIITLGIKRRIEKTTDKQQFIRERDMISEKLIGYIELIRISDSSKYFEILVLVHRMLEQILRYKIWTKEDYNIINNIAQTTARIISKEVNIDNQYVVEINMLLRSIR